MCSKSLYIFIIGILMIACSQSQKGFDSQTAKSCLDEAETALANDSTHLGETLLRKTIHLAEASEDWHTCYIAYQRLAEAIPDERWLVRDCRIYYRKIVMNTGKSVVASSFLRSFV